MIEKHSINERDFWIRIDPHPVERPNSNVIPTEYFTAMYYLHDPADENSMGILIRDEDEAVKLFESPVAALGYATKILEKGV